MKDRKEISLVEASHLILARHLLNISFDVNEQKEDGEVLGDRLLITESNFTCDGDYADSEYIVDLTELSILEMLSVYTSETASEIMSKIKSIFIDDKYSTECTYALTVGILKFSSDGFPVYVYGLKED